MNVKKHTVKETPGQAHHPKHVAPDHAKLLMAGAEGVVDLVVVKWSEVLRLIALSSVAKENNTRSNCRVRGRLLWKSKAKFY